ncbi:patatin-like phospholipase family protein [Methylobacterium sp. J-070]|uniref:patatin-like phospholipase family protein n=1 Tax=Methylobacterium sp. J-070 TaxID=2836650 RepID=UPI001FB908BE|nr:patatin-like phospholipase family protein [Methylobacterium sp. J-070]MCJ2054309.1 patatin-like phospholipase family protein [Methylobacterium sp. J-070]
MAEPGSRRIEIGLVLQGGGALGAYEWGAVTALLDLIAKARSDGLAVELRGVTGVSVGAINAACVVGSTSLADAQRRLSGLWADLTLHAPPFTPPTMARDLAFFGLPGFYVPRADVWNLPAWTSLYDTSPLLRTLRTHVDFGALNASGTAFVVTAVDLESGALTRFRNAAGRPPPSAGAEPDASDPAVTIGPEHVLASGSLAPQFPWTEIGGRRYWDGGLVDNTPLGDAIDALSADPATIRLLVVMNLYPLRARVPANMGAVLDRVHELSFGNRLRQDRDAAKQVNAMLATIDDLATRLEAGGGEIPGALRERIAQFARLKLVEVLEVDFQDRGPSGETRFDDENGLRDFSAGTVEQRRAYGYELATARLACAFTPTRETAGRTAFRSRLMTT